MSSNFGYKAPGVTIHPSNSIVDLTDGHVDVLQRLSGHGTVRSRRDSQFHAVAHTLNKVVAGPAIRSWSAYFFAALSVQLCLFVGITKQNLRPYLYEINTSLARLELLFAVFTAFTLPPICRFCLKTLSALVAGHLLAENAYSTRSACLLLNIDLGMWLDVPQVLPSMRSEEKGVRGIIVIRLISDYIVYLTAPFIALSLYARTKDNTCWMSFDWGWSLLVIFWPTLWSIGAVTYMLRYWRAQQCVRSPLSSTKSSMTQAARDMVLLMDARDQDAKENTKWRYGYRMTQNGPIDPYLGLVPEDECISVTEMLLDMEQNGPGHPMQGV